MVLGFSPHLSSLPLIVGCPHPLSPDHLLQRFTAYHLMQGQSLSLSLSLIRKTSGQGSDWPAWPKCFPLDHWAMASRWAVSEHSHRAADGDPRGIHCSCPVLRVSCGHAQPGPGAQDAGQGGSRWVSGWVRPATERGFENLLGIRGCWGLLSIFPLAFNLHNSPSK